MGNLWHSFILHWRVWALSGVAWLFGTFVGAAFKWRYGSYKEWNAERKEKRERAVDSRVIQAMKNFDLWKTAEMAKYLKLERDAVVESLERLEMRGRVKRAAGSLNDPAPWWFILPR
jgi:hypothetical protein